jgi:pyruvate formate-lyase/glycerol dehydratase family glycyl radical enzyme
LLAKRATRRRAGIESNSRVSKLRKEMLCIPELCIERGYLITESYKETESDPPVIRRAKALAKILAEMSIHIEDGELIVGTATSKKRGGTLTPEVHWDWYLNETETISTREWDRFAPLTEEGKTKMKEFLPYWEGKSLYEKWCAIVPESTLKLQYKTHLPVSCPISNMHLSHNCPGYEKVLTKGLNGVKEEVDKELGKLNLTEIEDFKKSQFFKAVNITLEAAIGFAKRYAELASNMVEKETDIQRKAELERIAQTCDWVPANPARSFYEALQSVWLTYIVLMIEGWGPGLGFGRADQYLYPFYKKDIEEGSITREEACELLALFFIKLNGLTTPFSSVYVRSQPGFAMLSNITLGGVIKEGKDAVNELSYLFLDAEKDVRLSNEEIVIRVHKSTPEAFLMKACEVAKLLRGKLKFVSDESTIQQFLSDGKPIEYARDYAVTGCFLPVIPARSHDYAGDFLNLPLILELALNNGVSRLTGEQLGPKTGDPRKFKSYDEVWNAYKKQVETQILHLIPARIAYAKVFAEFGQTPFLSSLYDGCVEKGLDFTNGGTAPYNTYAIWVSGAPNVGDSLAAIKKTVFEDKKITMDRLIAALDKNFEGEEEILHILKSAPKFGNDDDYVDSIVSAVLTHASDESAKYTSVAGAKSNLAAGTVTASLPLGYVVGALPDGRKASEPLSEGGISPYQGRNVSGPTATMMSVAKLNHLKLTGGSVLNMRFNPDVLKDDSKIRKFVSLIRTFCETGGYLVQFNVVGSDVLRDAQRYPEKYRDLLVRVATYSAYYVDLPPELQDDLIARTEFQEV